MRIIVTGLIGQHPALAGVSWDYLQYPLGLLRLGHDVYYIEDSGEWPYNLVGGASPNDWVARDPSPNISHLAEVMARFGMGERWGYRFATEGRWFGMSDVKRKEVIASADLLLNVSGTLQHPDEYRDVPLLVYIDTDPVFTQVKLALRDPLFTPRALAHDVHFTFGETLSSDAVPTEIAWKGTRQPIVLEEWLPTTETRDVFTTVMSWTSYQPLQLNGTSYGQKDVEFYRFLNLPERLPAIRFEVAMSGITPHVDWQTAAPEPSAVLTRLLSERADWSASELLKRNGWCVVDSSAACAGLDGYRDYVRSSKAEWSVAKNGYVRGRCGWFSCRSACYLATGRPVILQDTGFSRVLPTGKGLFAFSTADEAVAHVQAVKGNYGAHARAAHAIAAEFFDSGKILADLLERAGSA